MIVGVTGGMGSGKTALTSMLAELGASVVNADLVAHRVVGSAALLGPLVEAFGGDIVDGSGELDRRVLGRKALQDAESLDKLYEVIRPQLECELKKELDRAVATMGSSLLIFDAPLIYEWGIQGWVDVVVLVDCEEKVRIERVIARSGMERREIKRRMALQMDADEKKTRANIVIDNNGDMAQLRDKANQLWRDLHSWRQRKGKEENDRG